MYCDETRKCRVYWTYSPRGDDDQRPYPHIAVEHMTPTTAGSEVVVTRWFPGRLLGRQSILGEWSSEQSAAVTTWVDRLHRMPLEEIP